MKKNIILIIVLSLYILGPVLFFIADLSKSLGFGLNFLEDNLPTFKFIQTYFLSSICLMAGTLLGYGFYKNDISRYRLSDISGILGIVTSFISLSAIPFFQIFVWVLLVSGILCFYSMAVPLVDKFYSKMQGNKWEQGAVTAALSFLLIYWLGYKSDILLSQIFFIDPAHFSYAKFIASLVVIAPYAFFVSFGFTLYFSFKTLKTKEGNGQQSFVDLNGMLSSLVLFTFSFAVSVGGVVIIQNVASEVDFNPNSICSDIDKNEGVIYLDPIYNLILVNGKNEEKQHTYTVQECKPALNKALKSDS